VNDAGRARRIGAALALAAGVGVATWAWSRGGLDLDPLALRARIEALGWLAPLAFVAVAALRPFLAAPSWVVMAAGGLLFGVMAGVAYGIVGFTAGAWLTFGIARGLGREAVEQRLHGRLGRADAWISARGSTWLALYTALPVVPLTPGHAAAGLSSLPLAAFTGAVVVGLLPRTAMLAFFGDAFARGDWAGIGAVCVLLAGVSLAGIALTRRLGRVG
jgi:uncharacterized membrane protein YdjX (TVP38/TMEM64 family)